MYKRDSFDAKLIGILAILLVIIWVINSCTSTNAYNNGICTKCGGHYVYQQAVGHRYTTDYIYICDKCGDMITINYYARPDTNK